MASLKERLIYPFTGGTSVQEAKVVVREVAGEDHLSTRNRRRLTAARADIGRWHGFLFRGITAGAVLGIGISVLIDHNPPFWAINNSNTPDRNGAASGDATGVVKSPDIGQASNEKADQIRQQIREYEERNAGSPITQKTLTPLLTLVAQLHNATYGKGDYYGSVKFFTPENTFQRRNRSYPDVPRVESWYIVGNNQATSYYQIEINLGKDEINDPQLPKISVFKALIMNAIAHIKTRPIHRLGVEFVGDQQIIAEGTQGLSWFGSNLRNQEKAKYFNTINSLILAKYMFDPKGDDDLFQRIARSPFYWQSLPPVEEFGAEKLAKIYSRLGISVKDIEFYYAFSQPQALFNKIDSELTSLGLNARSRQFFLVTLISLDPKDPLGQKELDSLDRLLSLLPPIA